MFGSIYYIYFTNKISSKIHMGTTLFNKELDLQNNYVKLQDRDCGGSIIDSSSVISKF